MINYIDTHTDINVYIELSSEDPVGNSILLATYIPPKNIFYNYTITPKNDNTSTVTLNFDDKAGNDAAKVLDFKPYKASALTCIYYAKKIPGVNINDLVLERNFLYDENPNSSRTPHRYNYDQNGNRVDDVDRDPYGSFTDPHDFVIDNDSEYIAVIHTSYPFNINDTWCNTTSSVLCVIDNISVANASSQAFTDSNLSGKIISASKEIGPANSGIATITVNFPGSYTKDNDVNYYYGWSTDDGKSWSYFDTNPFKVSIPLKAPASDWYETANLTLNKYDNEYTHTSADETYPIANYTTTAKVKILAQKDGASGIVESATAELVFKSETDDKTPPVETSWIKAHELSYTADGSYFYTPNSLIIDNEWNPSDEYTYYYTQFNPSWLAQTNILSESEIKQLPHANQKTYFSHWKEDGTLHYNQQLSVPVNGLPDGDYMIFYTVSDKSNNSTSGTLGRIQIGTFKNKLSVNYNNNIITAELKLESNESFQQNNFFAEFFEDDKWKAFCSKKDEKSSTTSYYKEEGKSFSNLFYFCSNKMKKSGNKVTFASNDTESPAGYKNYNQAIPTGKFYRMNVTSANIDSKSNFSKYNEYGNPEYFDESGLNPWTDRMYYDIYTNETASYPTYLYIPSSETEVEDVKHSLDPFSGKLLSNKNVLINVISSLYDLGDNIDEWERRGKVIKTQELSPQTGDIINFTYSDAQTRMYNSGEKGKRYYVITYHFIDNESSISKVFTSY